MAGLAIRSKGAMAGKRHVLRTRAVKIPREDRLRNYVRLETQKITREPQGGKSFWFMLFAGCFIGLVGAFLFASSPGEQWQRFFAAGQAGVGIGMALTATAELLPKDKRKFAAVLRVFALAALALGAAGAATVFFA